MSSVVSKNSLWDNQLVRGKSEPRVIVRFYSCNNLGDNSLCLQSSAFVPVILPALASQNLRNSGGQRTTIFEFG
jgi:hypothetical protein